MIGLGGIGQRHLRNLRQLYGDSIDIIAWRRRKLNHVLTDRLQIAEGRDLKTEYNFQEYETLNEALSQKPNMAFICTPSSMHIEEALECAKAGCHLFIEKPLSADLTGLDCLIKLVHDKKLVSFVAYQLRFHPCYIKLKKLIDDKVLGKVISVRAEVGEYLPGFHKYEDYRQMYASRKDQGGGVIKTQIHEIDYLYSLFGIPEDCISCGGKMSSLEIDVEDLASIIFRYKDFSVNLHMDYLQAPPARTCKILGTDGKIELDFQAQSIAHYSVTGENLASWTFPDFERNELFLAELKHFIECVEQEKETLIPISEGAQSLKMALAATESLNADCFRKISHA